MDCSSLSDETIDDTTESSNGLFNMRMFNETLSVSLKFLNEDMILLGYYGIFDLVDEDVFLNVVKFASICCKIIKSHKNKLSQIDEIEDKKRLLSTELTRMERLYGKKNNEFETLAGENSKLKETIKDKDGSIKELHQQLKVEQSNIRNLKSSVEREKSQIQNNKIKMEKEMECLKERMNKLLSDPKRQYGSIDINSAILKRSESASSDHQRHTTKKNFTEEMSSNYKQQIEDLIMENRQIKEHMVLQLGRLKRLCGEGLRNNSNQIIPIRQRNNSNSSTNSSISDISIKSNETFVISNSVLPVDERIYLEMQFDLVKDDISQLFHEYYEKIDRLIRDICPRKDLLTSNTPCPSNEAISNSFENISRLQKEIFQLRKRLTDYEDIIQSKDSLIETAIQQRIKRGSLVSET